MEYKGRKVKIVEWTGCSGCIFLGKDGWCLHNKALKFQLKNEIDLCTATPSHKYEYE